MTLFIGNLPFSTDETDLRDFFQEAGFFTKRVSVPRDPITENGKGFAFVEISDDETARQAIAELDGQKIQNRTIKVQEKRPKSDAARN